MLSSHSLQTTGKPLCASSWTFIFTPLIEHSGPKKDELTGEWRKLHNEELRDLYSLPSIIRIIKARRMRWAGHIARMGRRGTRISCWWESQRERPRRRCVDDIRMDLMEVGWGDLDRIGLAQDRDRWRALVNSVLNLRVPQKTGVQTIRDLSSSAQLHGVS
jgi:hypothetical protein